MRATRKKRGEVPTTSRRWVVEGSGEGEKVSCEKAKRANSAKKQCCAKNLSGFIFFFVFGYYRTTDLTIEPASQK
jgi:hypothetical protein